MYSIVSDGKLDVYLSLPQTAEQLAVYRERLAHCTQQEDIEFQSLKDSLEAGLPEHYSIKRYGWDNDALQRGIITLNKAQHDFLKAHLEYYCWYGSTINDKYISMLLSTVKWEDIDIDIDIDTDFTVDVE